MTLRLDDEAQAALDALAASSGVSKQEAVRRAIIDSADRHVQRSDVLHLGEAGINRYRDLLDRLGQ